MKKLLRNLSITLIISLIACKEDVPEHHPSLLVLKDNRVLKHKLVDKENLKYQSDTWETLSYVDGGYCFPKGELEKVLDHIRNNKCENSR